MGCGSGKATLAYEEIAKNPNFPKWAAYFQALQLTQTEVRRLHSYFFKADMDNGGTIELVELLTVVDVDRTKFTERVFSIFDEDGSGKIDFCEFILALWNYCTLSKVTLSNFAFDLYDRDGTGILEEHDLEGMLKDIYGREWNTSHYAKAVQKELTELISKCKEIDLEVFTKYTQTHHSLLFPAFQMQLMLRTKIMGVTFWENHANRRIKLSNNKYMKIKDFLALIANKDLKGINEVLAPKAQILVANTGTHFDRIKRKKQQAEALARAELQQRSKDVTNINAADNGESVVPSSKNPRRRSFDNAATESGKKTTTTAGSVAPSSSASETMNELDQLINKNVETKAPGGGRRSSVATSKPTASVQNSVPTPEVTPPVDAAASSTEGHGHGADMASIQAAIAAKNRVKNRRRSL